MTTHTFETPRPISLYVENGSGSISVTAEETAVTTVEISGRHADEAIVRQDGDQISVLAPKMRAGFLGGDAKLSMVIGIPTDSTLAIKSGSADVTARGSYRAGQVKSGSGDVGIEILDGPAVVETGSGDVRIDTADQELRVKSGSGDVEIGSNNAPAVIKTGSGDLTVLESHGDVAMTTGSGDFVVRSASRGRLTAKAASGDVHVGIPAGVPVWTDISTVSGHIRSTVQGAGEPDEGADHVELRAKSVSGDINLTQI